MTKSSNLIRRYRLISNKIRRFRKTLVALAELMNFNIYKNWMLQVKTKAMKLSPLLKPKGQTKLQCFFQADDSIKKRTRFFLPNSTNTMIKLFCWFFGRIRGYQKVFSTLTDL